MVNFRVANLDAFLVQLRAADIEVTLDPKNYPNGRFARLHDPEGNPIELWQPAGRDASIGAVATYPEEPWSKTGAWDRRRSLAPLFTRNRWRGGESVPPAYFAFD
jgi:hypothetical protein